MDWRDQPGLRTGDGRKWIEDRWIIAGRRYKEGGRLTGWLATHAGTLPAPLATLRQPGDYGRRN